MLVRVLREQPGNNRCFFGHRSFLGGRSNFGHCFLSCDWGFFSNYFFGNYFFGHCFFDSWLGGGGNRRIGHGISFAYMN